MEIPTKFSKRVLKNLRLFADAMKCAQYVAFTFCNKYALCWTKPNRCNHLKRSYSIYNGADCERKSEISAEIRYHLFDKYVAYCCSGLLLAGATSCWCCGLNPLNARVLEMRMATSQPSNLHRAIANRLISNVRL